MDGKKQYYAIIDIGSNSIRLVVYSRAYSSRLQEVENVKTVARLRNELDEEQNLSEEGIVKLISILLSFREVIKNYHLTEFVCIATATVRQAKNREEVLHRVYEATGWKLQVLSEKEEAYYGYLAVVHSTTIDEGITVDIGGGSTEITYFKNRKLLEYHSFPFGALTLKKFFTSDKPQKMEIDRLLQYLFDHFKQLTWLKNESVPLVGIGGSARSLVQIHQNGINYPLAGLHQYAMDGVEIKKICEYLAMMSLGELERIEGLSKDRTDIILPASLVFLALYQTIGAKMFILSRKGLREGFFYEYLADDAEGNHYPNVLKDSILEMVHEYGLQLEQISHVAELAKKILDTFIAHRIGQLTPDDWNHLLLGCYVYNLGNYIDSESSSQHTFYLLANRTIDGLLHIDRLKMALVASFKNKTVFHQYLEPFTDWFTKGEQHKLWVLGALLKLIYSLDATKRKIVQDVRMECNLDTIFMTVYCNGDYMLEQYQAEKQKKHLEKAINKQIVLDFVKIV